jgi:DnaJ family protein C protein 11
VNPHKRAIYDELGVDGLKQKFFEVGVKTMDPDEFKIWLQEQIRKQKVENVMSLVNSRGEVVIALDVSGAGLKKIVRTLESGEKEVGYRLITPVRLTKYVVKHSFTLPLEGLGELLTTPFNSSITASSEKNEPQMKHVPSLSLTASLGGIPVQTENKGWTYLSSPGLSVQIGHSFPSLPPKSPLSIASILAGLDFEIASTIFPQRVVSTSISKSFGASRLVFKPTFNSSPLLKPPSIEATYVSSIGKRSSFFMQYNTGLAGKWPLALSQIFSNPSPSSHFTIGWVAMPIGESPVAEDVNDENYVPTQRPNKSKSTETWRITATACPSLGFGGQLGLSWGRTYFVGTPIGPSSSKNPKELKKSREGIRINVDATVVTVTALVVKIKATRKIFTNTRMGAGIGISAGGVIFTLDWSRLGQKISIPVGIASTSGSSVLYGTLAPFLGYALLEWVYLRPRERKLWKKEVEQKKRQLMVKVIKNRRRADELVGLMSDYVKHSQQKMLERGGLVILEARYGINGKAGEWIDVTIPLAGLIEDEQLVIPRGLNKVSL